MSPNPLQLEALAHKWAAASFENDTTGWTTGYQDGQYAAACDLRNLLEDGADD